MSFTEIIPGLWMGGETLPALPSGFDAVVNCRALQDWSFFGLANSVLWIPFIDGSSLPATWTIRMGSGFIKEAMKAGLKTLVHCAEGHNRSGLIIGTYLIHDMPYPMSPQEAIDLIRSKRPGALSNKVFVDYLLTRLTGQEKE